MSGPESSLPAVDFDETVAPLLFADAVASPHPRLHLALSASARGYSRAIGRIPDAGVVLNARDLEPLALGAGAATAADSSQVAAQWLQRGLTEARERRASVTLEGTFRSPALVIGVAQLFAEAGYETGVATVAERVAEVRMADASRRFDVELRQRRTHAHPPSVRVESLEPLLSAVVDSRVADRVLVLDRDGHAVVDEGRDSPEYASAARMFAEAAARPLGTLRSAGWLSELRHMTRFLAQQGPAPRWAVEDLIGLHEFALTDIVPELPIPADSETRHVQVARLSGTLSALRESLTSTVPQDPTAAVALPVVGGVGLGR